MILKLLDRYTYKNKVSSGLAIYIAQFIVTVVTIAKSCRSALLLALDSMTLSIKGQPELAHTAKTRRHLISNTGFFRGNRGCRTALYLHLLKGTLIGMLQHFSRMAQAQSYQVSTALY